MIERMEDLRKRVLLRFSDDEDKPADAVCGEFIQSIYDRLCILIDADTLPPRADSIVVDAAVRAIRQRGFEGMSSESASEGGSVSNSFITNVLESYSDDIERLRKSVHGAHIKFL